LIARTGKWTESDSANNFLDMAKKVEIIKENGLDNGIPELPSESKPNNYRLWRSSQFGTSLVLSTAALVLVLEWTVTSKPNIEHGAIVGYRGY
jgi:hypothetical protein